MKTKIYHYFKASGHRVIFLCDCNKEFVFYKLHENISASTFLTVNFVACRMQQNQINFILLDVKRNKNSYFKDVEKIFCVTTFWNAFSGTSIIQPMIFFSKIYSQWRQNCFGLLWYFLKCIHWKLGHKSPMQFIWKNQILKIKLYVKIIVWWNNHIIC